MRARNFEDALDAFKDANKLRDKKSPEALHGMCKAYHGFGAFKNAANACEDALEYVGNDQRLAAILHNDRGLALSARARKNTDKVLQEAEEEFRAVVLMTAELPMAWYNLGAVVLRQGRDEEGIAALRNFLATEIDAPEVELAKRMIENPRRAREPFAPEFSFASLEGDYVNLEDLRGKTVLLDFWGMWCAPCRVATPALVRLQRNFSDESFVMVGLNSDPTSKTEELLDYISDNEMAWPNYIDRDRAIHRAYNVTRFPTYIVVDSDGVITERAEGWSNNTIHVLNGAIRKSLKAAEKKGLNLPQPLAPPR